MKAEKKATKKKIKASRSKQMNKRKTPGTAQRGPSTNKYR